DQVSEVVGHNAQVVAMVRDVGGKKRSIAPAVDDLLAPLWCLPVHFHVQFIGFDQTRRSAQSFPTGLGQEEDEAVCSSAVALERRVSLHCFPPLHSTAGEREGSGGIPA